MKYPVCLIPVLLFIAAPAQAQLHSRTPNAALFAEPPAASPPAARGFLGVLVSLLTPRVERPLRVEGDQETWARLSRLRIPDKEANSDYMMRGILVTAAVSAGVVGLGLWDTTSHRTPRFAVKACRSGAMIGIQGRF